MDILTQKVLKTIDKYNLIDDNVDNVVAAVSGGYDSLCMLYVLYDLQRIRSFQLHVAHVNHSFRKEANSDEAFVRDTCLTLGIPFYSKKIDVLAYSKENKISFETAGREIRYHFFDSLLKKISNCVIATAHNANDSAESFMMHLIRGSGMKGLVGIRAKNGEIIRPLIEMERSGIELYCKEHHLNPRIDSTNISDDYLRNDIRHNVMPAIIDRGGLNGINNTIQIIKAEEEFMQQYVLQIADKYITSENAIRIKDFNAFDLAIKRRLILLMLPQSSKQVSLIHIDSIINLAKKNYGGKIAVLPGGITAQVEKGMLLIKGE